MENGSLYSTIQKVKRKKFDVNGECKICRVCVDRSLCNNREGHIKCKKCKECKIECLKYCDRFYVQELNVVQLSVKGKKKTVGSDKEEKNAIEKKNKAIAKIQNGVYINKSTVNLIQCMKDAQDMKLNSEKGFKENSYNRNINCINYIKKHHKDLANKHIQKISTEDIAEILKAKKEKGSSKSDIEKTYFVIKAGFNLAMSKKNRIILKDDNPLEEVEIPISDKQKEIVTAFEVDEQAQLLNYINTHTIITDTKSLYDDVTVKNIIRFAFATGMRIGEIGALDKDKHIDFKNEQTIVERTLTKNKEGKVVIGDTTKTGNKRMQYGKSDIRFVPFDIFEKSQVIYILEDQIEIADSNPNNKYNLLFCRKDGNFIHHGQINQIFKRVCREAGVKLNLPKGCHTHMTKHTFVTRCIEAGMELMTISNLVGTSVREIEKTYAHILNQFKNKQIGKVRNHLKKNNIIAFKVIESNKNFA